MAYAAVCDRSAGMIHIFSLFIATTIWGFGFIATKWALEVYSPFWVNASRYWVALVLCSPFLFPAFKKGWKHLVPGFYVGALVYVGMYLQTLGLELTTVAKSGFFTAFYVLFIPLISMILYKKRYSSHFWICLLLAIFGVALLCELKISSFNLGDFYTILCAICFALHIVYVGRIANRYGALELNSIQIFSASILGLFFSFFEKESFSFSLLYHDSIWSLRSPFMSILFLGLFSSVIAFSIQNSAQKYISSHVAGMVFLLESPIAALFAFLLLSEYLTRMQVMGCMVILFAVFGVSFFSKKVRKIKS